jgi:hypothetical protein
MNCQKKICSLEYLRGEKEIDGEKKRPVFGPNALINKLYGGDDERI